MKDERAGIRKVRVLVQLGFLALSVLIGWEFYQFVYQFAEPGGAYVHERPAGVDAFLPIGAVLGIKHYLNTQMIDPFHPAGMFVFLAAIFVAYAAKKGFCGWICPVGTISEYLWKLGRKVFGRNFALPFFTDLPLMGLKYLLLGLILFLAFAMPFLYMFFISDYYRMVDVHMLMLFVKMSTTTAVVMAVLVALGVFIKNFWCRYLCPYGALLGIVSKFSPMKVRRDSGKCIGCKSCTKNCPSLIEVHKEEAVDSAECFGCLTCVSHCPAKGALEMTWKPVFGERKALRRLWIYPVVVIGAFYLIIGIGMATGNWQTKTPMADYRQLVPDIVNPGKYPAQSPSEGGEGSASSSSGTMSGSEGGPASEKGLVNSPRRP